MTRLEATGLTDRGRLREGALGEVLRVRMLGETRVLRSVSRG